jgi:ferredoxin
MTLGARSWKRRGKRPSNIVGGSTRWSSTEMIVYLISRGSGSGSSPCVSLFFQCSFGFSVVVTPVTLRAVALEIEINRDACMGSGNCSFWAPGVFDLDDDGVAVVLDPTAQPEEKVILAGQGCPTQAITIVKDGEKIV